jgi:hypothetical protein
MFLCIDFGSTNLVLGSAYHRTLEQDYLTITNGTVFSADQALKSPLWTHGLHSPASRLVHRGA